MKLMQPRKVNQAIEVELIEFKREIEEKFAKSMMNWEYFFPWKPVFKPLEEEIDLADLSENIECNEFSQ